MTNTDKRAGLTRTGWAAAWALAAAGLLAAPAAAAPKAQPKARTLTIDHLMKMRTPSDVHIDPSGRWVAYVVERTDEGKDKTFKQIWMTSIDGMTTLPLTAAYASASNPRWNPDGSSLAFLGKRGDTEDLAKAEAQVWLLDRRGGEAQQYTNIKQGVESFAWSPDGTRVVLVIKDPKPEDKAEDKDKDKDKKERPKPWVIDRLQFKEDYVGYLDRRRTHLYLFDGSGTPVQLTSGDYDDSDPQWSPDGTTIAFVSKRQGDPDANDNSDIWTVRADAKAKTHPLTQVTTNPGSDKSPAWSPDGKRIAYVTVTEPKKLWYATQNLAVIASKGGTPRILTQSYDRMVSEPEFSPAGDGVYFMAEDGGNRPLLWADVGSGAVKPVTTGEAVVREFSVHSGGTIAFLRSTHHEPFEVHVREGDEITRLTHLNDEVLAGVKLGNVARLKVPGYNGEQVESFVYMPPGYVKRRAYPAIFFLQGGPTSQHDTSFDAWGQLFAANGYVAVLPNPHGSTGYGEPFCYSLYKQWGVPDFADVDAVATYLVKSGVARKGQLGVGGWSYGGMLTDYVITKSTRFAGAVSGASEVNYRANYGHDIYQYWWEVELGLPWEHAEDWERISPFNDLGKVTTPTLVIGGKEDWNVPIMNSEQLYQVLKRRGIDTQLVVYPGEFHGIKRPSFVRDRYQRFLDWYAKYVKR